MNLPILAGIETEYGLTIESRDPTTQIHDAQEFLEACKEEAFIGWDYSNEFPRKDLRGFEVDKLNANPLEAQYNSGAFQYGNTETRADRILHNGARFYNDHGHPEYSTPECFSLSELALHDKAGEIILFNTAQNYSKKIGKEVKIYKNNSDYHGSSYGTHENYLVPRSLGYEKLFQALIPMLIVRQVLCGAGKVGSENGIDCKYQLSPRADFFTCESSVDTLHKRPIFNTRDEPHADPDNWIRLHVISGDANRITSCTQRKVALIKCALSLAIEDKIPSWNIENPVQAIQKISRDMSLKFEIPLQSGKTTNAFEILQSYFKAFTTITDYKDPEVENCIAECEELIQAFDNHPDLLTQKIDWAAKRHILETFIEDQGISWSDPYIKALELQYHLIDPKNSLYDLLLENEQIEDKITLNSTKAYINQNFENNRAAIRGKAIRDFSEHLITANWNSLTFKLNSKQVVLPIEPHKIYNRELFSTANVEYFINSLRG